MQLQQYLLDAVQGGFEQILSVIGKKNFKHLNA